MDDRTARRWLWLVFLIVLAGRLVIALSVTHFSSDEAYFHLRQADHILQTGLPLFDDPLSWSGKSQVFLPIWDYLLAGAGWLVGLDAAAKILPNIFAALLIPLVYAVARRRASSISALIAALIAGAIPVFVAKTVNHASPVPAAFALLLTVLYAFSRATEPRWAFIYTAGIVLFTFFHPLVYLLVLGLGLYLILLLAQDLRHERVETELSLFTIFFVLWGGLLVYKSVLLFHGPSMIWQNLPRGLLINYFADVSVTEALFLIGIIPVAVGLFVVYRHLFLDRRRDFYLAVSFTLTAGVLLWLKLVPLDIGLSLLGILLALLCARGAEHLDSFITATRLRPWRSALIAGALLLIIATSAWPSWTAAENELRLGVSADHISALRWIAQNTPPSSRIIAAPSEGFLISAVAHRHNAIDRNLFLRNDVEQRFEDLRRLYVTSFETEAVGILDKLDADYIILSPRSKRVFQSPSLKYVDKEGGCIRPVYETETVSILMRKSPCRVRLQ